MEGDLLLPMFRQFGSGTLELGSQGVKLGAGLSHAISAIEPGCLAFYGFAKHELAEDVFLADRFDERALPGDAFDEALHLELEEGFQNGRHADAQLFSYLAAVEYIAGNKFILEEFFKQMLIDILRQGLFWQIFGSLIDIRCQLHGRIIVEES
jgi:hypothetical protein